MTQFARSRRATSVLLPVAMLLVVAFGTACGGGSLSNSGGGGNGSGGGSNPPPPPPASSLTLTPTSATIYAGQTITFKATVNGTTDQTVTWSVNGVVGGNSTVGTVNIYGLYQSPGAMPSPNQITIRAVSTTNANAAASAAVTVNNAIPHIAAVTPDSFQSPASFTLTISGTGFANGAVVNWGSTQLATTYVSPTQLTASGRSALHLSELGQLLQRDAWLYGIKPGTGDPLRTLEPVTVASFRTWRGWRENVAWDQCLTVLILTSAPRHSRSRRLSGPALRRCLCANFSASFA